MLAALQESSVRREVPYTEKENAAAVAEHSWTAPVPAFGAGALRRIHEFRESIWRNEHGIADAQKFDPASLWDEHDAHGLHWIITAGPSIVASARLCIHAQAETLPAYDRIRHLLGNVPAPFASLNQLVVHPALRRQGLSRALTDVRIDAARSRGAKTMLSEAAPNRVLGLRDLGFKDLGQTEKLPWDLVPFTLMSLDLSD
jgi:GNAT superfamily N-acetyltransferase